MTMKLFIFLAFLGTTAADAGTNPSRLEDEPNEDDKKGGAVAGEDTDTMLEYLEETYAKLACTDTSNLIGCTSLQTKVRLDEIASLLFTTKNVEGMTEGKINGEVFDIVGVNRRLGRGQHLGDIKSVIREATQLTEGQTNKDGQDAFDFCKDVKTVWDDKDAIPGVVQNSKKLLAALQVSVWCCKAVWKETWDKGFAKDIASQHAKNQAEEAAGNAAGKKATRTIARSVKRGFRRLRKFARSMFE